MLGCTGRLLPVLTSLEHRQRRHLRGSANSFRCKSDARPRQALFLIIAIDPDPLSLLAEHDRRAGVLTHRQHAARRDIGVLQKIQRHEPGSLALASRSSRIARNDARCAGHRKCDTSWNARTASSLNASGAIRSTDLAVACDSAHAFDGQFFPRRPIGAERKHGRVGKPEGRAIGARSFENLLRALHVWGTCGGGTRQD